MCRSNSVISGAESAYRDDSLHMQTLTVESRLPSSLMAGLASLNILYIGGWVTRLVPFLKESLGLKLLTQITWVFPQQAFAACI